VLEILSDKRAPTLRTNSTGEFAQTFLTTALISNMAQITD